MKDNDCYQVHKKIIVNFRPCYNLLKDDKVNTGGLFK